MTLDTFNDLHLSEKWHFIHPHICKPVGIVNSIIYREWFIVFIFSNNGILLRATGKAIIDKGRKEADYILQGKDFVQLCLDKMPPIYKHLFEVNLRAKNKVN